MHRAIVCSLAGLLMAAGAPFASVHAAPAPIAAFEPTWEGSFSGDDGITLTLDKQPDGSFKGQLDFDGEKFPVKASLRRGRIEGAFTYGGETFNFTLDYDNDSYILESEGSQFALTREETRGPRNPLRGLRNRDQNIDEVDESGPGEGETGHHSRIFPDGTLLQAYDATIELPAGWEAMDDGTYIQVSPPDAATLPDGSFAEGYSISIQPNPGMDTINDPEFLEGMDGSILEAFPNLKRSGAPRRMDDFDGNAAMITYDGRNEANQRVRVRAYVHLTDTHLFSIVAVGEVRAIEPREPILKKILAGMTPGHSGFDDGWDDEGWQEDDGRDRARRNDNAPPNPFKDGRTFSDPDLGWAFHYRPDWTVEMLDGVSLAVVPDNIRSDAQGPLEYFVVTFTEPGDLAPGFEPEGPADPAFTRIIQEAFLAEAARIKPARPVDVDGAPWPAALHRFTAYSNKRKMNIQLDAYITIQRGMIITFVAIGKPEFLKEREVDVRPMFFSVHSANGFIDGRDFRENGWDDDEGGNDDGWEDADEGWEDAGAAWRNEPPANQRATAGSAIDNRLVGTWRYTNHSGGGTVSSTHEITVTLNRNGTFERSTYSVTSTAYGTVENGPETTYGRWSARNGVIIISADGEDAFQVPYHVQGDAILVDPQGERQLFERVR